MYLIKHNMYYKSNIDFVSKRSIIWYISLNINNIDI